MTTLMLLMLREFSLKLNQKMVRRLQGSLDLSVADG
jgi:hypothetical protein